MRRIYALLPAVALCLGCSAYSNFNQPGMFPEDPEILMADDLQWSADDLAEFGLDRNAVKGKPFLPPVDNRRDMRYSFLRHVISGTRPDGLPNLVAPDGYNLMVWKERPSDELTGWMQVFAYPADWQQRARRGLHSRDIGWAFIRRTHDLRGWENVSHDYPTRTWRHPTPAEEEVRGGQPTIWHSPRPVLWQTTPSPSAAPAAVASSRVACHCGQVHH